MQVPDAQLLQHIGNLLVSRAVEGGVDHAEGVGHLGHGLPVVNLIQHVGEEFVIGLPAQQGDEPLGPGLFVVHGPDIVKDIQGLHLGGDGRRVLGGQLGAVGPIDLVAIVLRGIVAGGDVESGHTAVLPHGEGELRRGAHGLKKAHGDAVGGHHPGGGPGKFLGVNPAVIADGHPLGGGGRSLGQDHLGKGLGGMADHMDVHPPQPQAHHPPQAGGAELQQAEEPVFHLFGVVGNGLQLGFLLRGQGVAVQPAMELLLIGHRKAPFSEGAGRMEPEPSSGLFVVAGACGNLEGPVNLLQHHDPGQMVGKGHGGHGQTQVGRLLH